MYKKIPLILNPYHNVLQKIIAPQFKMKEEVDDKTQEDKMAFAEVPNYLEQPVFTAIKPLLICMFQIRMDGFQPFMMFFLEQQKNVYNFIRFPSFDGGKNSTNLEQEAVEFMEKKCSEEEEISYAGFVETETHNILILKYTCFDDIATDSPSTYTWVTSYEVLNTRKVMDCPISPVVVQFFLYYPTFLYLTNEEERRYELPVIGYYNKFKHPCRESVNPHIGYCYYFYAELPTASPSASPSPTASPDTLRRVVLFIGRLSLKIASFGEVEGKYDSFLFTTSAKEESMYVLNQYSRHLIL